MKFLETIGECSAPVAPGSSRRVAGQPGCCAHNDIPSRRDSRGQNLTFDGTQGLGGGTSPMSVMCDPPPFGHTVHVGGTRSQSRCTVERFGVGGFFGPRRQAPILPNTNKWGFRVPVPSKPYRLPGMGSGNSSALCYSVLVGVWNRNPKSTSTAGELEGALVRVMYQGVCAGLQG